ncbi:MAG: hypothetical protein CMJ70_10415 [Planctomycetaceae bacterium]|nr:hypothetical protein [Planctomycetaceae bacterium]
MGAADIEQRKRSEFLLECCVAGVAEFEVEVGRDELQISGSFPGPPFLDQVGQEQTDGDNNQDHRVDRNRNRDTYARVF